MWRVYLGLVVAALLVLVGYGAASGAASSPRPSSVLGNPVDWPTFGFDAAHSGFNPNEIVLTTSTLSHLHRVWQARLPGTVDGPPILVHGLTLPDHTVHDVLFAITTRGTLIALDAASGHLLWAHAIGAPSGTTPSVLTSPVATASGANVYAYGADGAVHEFRAATGAEVPGNGWPVTVTRMPGSERVVSALTIDGNRLYVVTTGQPDAGGNAAPYQGHIVSVNLRTGAASVFNTLCSHVSHLLAAGACAASGAGIASPAGAVADHSTGDVFVATGAGPYSGYAGEGNWSDSVLELYHGALLLDAYATRLTLAAPGADLAAVAVLPAQESSRTPRLVALVARDGTLRLLNRDALNSTSSLGTAGKGPAVMPAPLAGCAPSGQPAVWVDTPDTHGHVNVHSGIGPKPAYPNTNHTWLYVPTTCGLRAYLVRTDSAGATRLQAAWHVGATSTSPIVAGGMVVVASGDRLLALDPLTGAQLWSSPQGDLGGIDQQSPILVNGVLYCADNAGNMLAYGIR